MGNSRGILRLDKKKPTYLLHDIHRLAKTGSYKFTITAQKTADALGFSQSDIVDVITTLELSDFYKSVNEYRNHRVWQDVYRTTVGNTELYIKVKVIDRKGQLLVIMSFKEQ